MKIDHLAETCPGPFDGVVCPAFGQTVVPGHDDLCMGDQKVVAPGITAAVVLLGKDLDAVGRGQNPLVAKALGRRKAGCLMAERNDGNEPDLRMPLPQEQNRLGRREVEPDGHTAQKSPEATFVKRLESREQQLASFVTIGAMAGEGDTGTRIEDHTIKDSALARSLQEKPLNSKTSATMKNTGIAIVSLVGGMIIGSALTMLFTPQSGADLRRKIKDSIDDEIDRVKNKLSEVEEQIEEARCRCEEN